MKWNGTLTLGENICYLLLIWNGIHICITHFIIDHSLIVNQVDNELGSVCLPVSLFIVHMFICLFASALHSLSNVFVCMCVCNQAAYTDNSTGMVSQLLISI